MLLLRPRAFNLFGPASSVAQSMFACFLFPVLCRSCPAVWVSTNQGSLGLTPSPVSCFVPSFHCSLGVYQSADAGRLDVARTRPGGPHGHVHGMRELQHCQAELCLSNMRSLRLVPCPKLSVPFLGSPVVHARVADPHVPPTLRTQCRFLTLDRPAFAHRSALDRCPDSFFSCAPQTIFRSLYHVVSQPSVSACAAAWTST